MRTKKFSPKQFPMFLLLAPFFLLSLVMVSCTSGDNTTTACPWASWKVTFDRGVNDEDKKQFVETVRNFVGADANGYHCSLMDTDIKWSDIDQTTSQATFCITCDWMSGAKSGDTTAIRPPSGVRPPAGLTAELSTVTPSK